MTSAAREKVVGIGTTTPTRPLPYRKVSGKSGTFGDNRKYSTCRIFGPADPSSSGGLDQSISSPSATLAVLIRTAMMSLPVGSTPPQSATRWPVTDGTPPDVQLFAASNAAASRSGAEVPRWTELLPI